MPFSNILLSALLASFAGGGLGFWLGSGIERGASKERELATATAYVEAWQSAVETTRRETEAESQRRNEEALRNARASARSREVKLNAQIEALKNDRVECRAPDVRMQFYKDAIRAANGDGS